MVLPKNHSKLHKLMAEKGRLSKRTKGQIVQTTDAQKSLNLVKTGYVKRYLINNDGSLGVDLIYGPGDIFSLTLVFKAMYDRVILDSPEVYYYEAMGNAEIYTLEMEILMKEVEADPMLYKDLLNESGKRMTSATQGLENISMKNAYKRVAHQLSYYGRRFGQRGKVSTKILPPLTHQDIADILGLTRETVSVCMMKLRRKGLIKSGRQIVIPSPEKLQEEAFK